MKAFNGVKIEELRPVFVDSEYGSWNVNPHLLATEPEKWTNKSIVPKAVVLVHIWLKVSYLKPPCISETVMLLCPPTCY